MISSVYLASKTTTRYEKNPT